MPLLASRPIPLTVIEFAIICGLIAVAAFTLGYDIGRERWHRIVRYHVNQGLQHKD
jgi:hypothetical protein